MPVYEVDIPGQGTFRVNSRRPLEEAEVIAAVQQQLAAPAVQAPAAPLEAGLPAAFKKGFESFTSGYQTGLTAPFGAEEAAKAGAAREEALAGKYAQQTGLDLVKKAYAERGLIPAAGEVARQIPYYLAEQAPVIASSAAGARLGAMAGAPFGPLGSVIGAVGGATLANFPLFAGSNVQRQYETQEATGETPDISLARAYGTGVAQSALEAGGTAFALGKTVVGKILGTNLDDLAARGTADTIRAAERSLLNTAARGVARGAGAEIPVEVGQQILERAQAGLPLLNEEAFAEYGEAAYGAALVGGSLGPVGSVLDRRSARKKIEGEKEAERELEESTAQESAEAEEERMRSPAYRQELNDKIYTLKDELAQIEPIAKDKTQDPDVRKEAIERAKEIKNELKTLQESFKQSMKEAGLAPTLAQAKAAGYRETPVVDEFGNVVTPKSKPLSEEEYGQKLESAATQWDQTREKIFELNEKEDRENAAARIVDQEIAQNQPFIKGTTPDGKALPFVPYTAGVNFFDPSQARKPKNISQDVWNASTRDQKIQMLKRERIKQYMTLLEDPQTVKNLEDAQLETERQKLNVFLEDEASKDQTATEISRRLARDEAVLDIAEFQINKAREQLGLGVLFLGPKRQQRLENAVNQGFVDRYAASILGIKNPEGRKRSVDEAMPDIENAIEKLKSERRSLTGKDIINPEGGLTPDGIRLVQIDTKLEEINRLLRAGAAEKGSATEQALAGRVASEGATQAKAPAVEIQEGLPSVTYKAQADEANKQASGRFLDLTALMDDYRKGRFFGEKGAKRDVKLASSLRQDLLAQSETARRDVVDNLIKEIAYRRMEQKLRPLTRDEAIGVGFQVDEILKELINRSTALPSGYSLEEVTIELAQMRGDKLVKEAQTQLRDTRDIKDRQFGSPRRAIEVLAEMIKQAKETAIADGKRAVRAARPLLRKQYAAPPVNLVQDLDRVLRMENLQPEVRQTLEQARRRLEEGGASEGLEELVEEQVGRILRGTDRPFMLERDVTKPGGKRAMAAAGKAELVDEIQTQLRFDSELAQFAQGEQRTLVPRGEGFAEVDVQPDLFPESVATARATPAQFQRLQKSGKVRKEKARVAEAEEKAKQIKRETRAAARDAELELKPEAIQSKKRDLLGRIQKLSQEMKDRIKESKFETPAELMEKVKDPQARSLLSRIEIAAKDLKAADAEFEMSPAGMRLTWVPDATLQKWASLDESIVAEAKKIKELERIAAGAEGGSLEQRKARALAKQQRVAVQQVLAARRKIAEQAADQQRALELRMQTGLGLPGVRATRKTDEQILAEMLKARKEKKKGETIKRPSKFEIVPIKSRAELEAEIAEREREQTVDLRRKAKATSPEDMFAKLQEDEAAAIQTLKEKEQQLKKFRAEFPAARKLKTKTIIAEQELDKAKKVLVDATAKKKAFENELRDLKEIRSTVKEAAERQALDAEIKQVETSIKTAEKAVEKAKAKTSGLREAFYDKQQAAAGKSKTLQMGEAKFNEFKKLSAEVDMAKENLASIRENLRLLEATQYVPESQRKRQAARGPVGGEVKWYDKKFTPQQLESMGIGGAGEFGNKTYSVEDNIDFRVGDNEGGGIDQEAADKRMADVEKKLPKGIKFKYFPTMADVTMDILRNMSAQGMNIYENRIRGGVKPDGTVFVVGGNHDSMLDLEQTIAHEFIGHYTFEGMLGPDGMKKLLNKIENNFGSVFKLAEQLGVSAEANAAFIAAKRTDASDTQANTTALREIVAYTMEKRVDQKFMQKAKRWIQELIGAMRAALKNMGLVDASKMSTSDLFYLMRQANQSFESGRPVAYRNSDGTVSFRDTPAGPAATGVGSMIATKGKMLDKIKGNLSGLNFRVQFVDRLAALDALVKKGVSKGIISSLKAYDVMYFNRMADQRNNFVAQFATNGVGEIVNRNGERMYDGGKGPSLKDVSQALNNSGVDPKIVEREFTAYLVALRAQRVGAKVLDFTGKKVTKADIDSTVAKYKNNAAFNKARDLYQQYNDNLIDFVVSSGALEKSKGAELKADKDYVPFYRKRGGDVELVISSEKFIRIGDLKNQPYLQELVGGETQILPVFTSALVNTSMLVDMALKNMATRNTAYVLRDLGVAKVHDKAGNASPNVIRFKVDGQERHAVIDTEAKSELFGDIPTELVVTGMEGIKATLPAGIQAMGLPATWLRRFVTRDPRYAIRQIFRDSMAAALTTGADFIPVVDTFKDMVNMKKSGATEMLQRRGIIGGQVITGNSDDMATILTQLASGKPGWEMAMAKLDELAMMGDAATRVSMYNSFIKQGLSEREATLATLEAMNFSRRGVSPSILYANTLIPFFNAAVQGIDVLQRAFRRQMNENDRLRVRQKLIARGLTMTAMTLAYAAVMDDDETYENANPDERYGNWFVPTPFGTFRVPIPFELGLIFKAAPEGVARMMFSDDKAGDVAKALRTMAIRSIPVDVPTAIKPWIELSLNKSFFTDRPIVDQGMEGLSTKLQYRSTTPELIKLFGEFGISPLQVEHLVRSYTGGLLVGLLRVPDAALGIGDVTKPTMKLTEVPIVGGLFQPPDSTGIVNSAYEAVKKAQSAAQTYKRMAESDPAGAREFLKDNLEEVSMASAAGKFRQQMGEIAKMERAIRENRTMSADKKRELLDKYRQIKIQMSKNFKKLAA